MENRCLNCLIQIENIAKLNTRRPGHAHPAGLYDWKPTLEQNVDYSGAWRDHTTTE